MFKSRGTEPGETPLPVGGNGPVGAQAPGNLCGAFVHAGEFTALPWLIGGGLLNRSMRDDPPVCWLVVSLAIC
jgi:hypothetical protein